jgi:hypothetical protein
MKTVFTLLLTCTLYILAAQKDKKMPPPPPPPIETIIPPIIPSDIDVSSYNQKPQVYDNIQTEKHRIVSGTHIGFIPPTDWLESSKLAGFESPDGQAGMIAFEVPVNIDKSIGDIMNPKTMKDKGIKPIANNRFMLNGYKAARFLGSNGMNELHMIVFGDSTFSAFINGFYGANNMKMRDKMWNAVNSSIYSKTVKIDPLAKAKFSLDLKDSGFKFNMTMMGSIYMFTPEDEKDKTLGSIMITQVPADENTSLDSFAEQMMSSLVQKGIAYNKKVAEKTITIGGIEALEKVIISQKSELDNKTFIYVLTLKYKDVAFAFMGMGADDKEETLNRFRKVADTFKIKK